MNGPNGSPNDHLLLLELEGGPYFSFVCDGTMTLLLIIPSVNVFECVMIL